MLNSLQRLAASLFSTQVRRDAVHAASSSEKKQKLN